ncbi:MAG: hypothetical protein JSW28_00410 [Thermoplasmata archaeon]|nr:MAG: hypothetical protein JSW28_00410 [Thermoplasmata archaeon]
MEAKSFAAIYSGHLTYLFFEVIEMIATKAKDYRNLGKIAEAKQVHNHLNGWKIPLCDINGLKRCIK